jgi:hypothetical protein
MKILYVEDQLSSNIERILELFHSLLPKTVRKKLKEINTDESGWGAEPNEIKALVEMSGHIDVEFRFPEALARVLNEPLKYAFFIIDRNLADCDYSFDEIKNVDSDYNPKLSEKYLEREGDYILQKVAYMGEKILERFFFLTAYSAEHEIHDSEELENHIDFGKFSEGNIIEKGNPKAFIQLRDRIKNCDILVLRKENESYLNILRDGLGEKSSDDFFLLLQEKDKKERIGENLTKIRKTYEGLIIGSAKLFPDMWKKCENSYHEIGLDAKPIKWLHENGRIKDYQREFFFQIKMITSKYGPHHNDETVTIDAVNSLLFALKDMIVWFGEIVRNLHQ